MASSEFQEQRLIDTTTLRKNVLDHLPLAFIFKSFFFFLIRMNLYRYYSSEKGAKKFSEFLFLKTKPIYRNFPLAG